MTLPQDIGDLKFSEIVKLVKSLEDEKSDRIPLKVAFLRNITLDLIVPYLKLFCFQEGLKAEIHMGEYDNAMQEAIDPESALYRFEPDIIVVCLKMENLSENLSGSFTGLAYGEITGEADRVISYIDTVLGEIRKNSRAAILVHSFEVPVYPAFGVLDYQGRSWQVNTFRKINLDLLDILSGYESVYLVDIEMLKSLVGYEEFIDNRYWHIGKAPYTGTALKTIAGEYMKFIRALKGKNRKCLVLDCDNTLWGGIIGEDGINKIQVGKTYPGSAYREFQQTVLNLYHRGIMLAICSKNNEPDVLEVLDRHPDMVLRRKHFVSIRINWNDKVVNLKEIAGELNIGLDGLVLVDDSSFEINLVRQLLPEVGTIQLPDDPSTYRDLLDSSGLFDTLTFSEEDRTRSKMYQAEAGRKKAKTGFHTGSLEEYYKYLEMEVTIQNADEFSFPRISQLTQRTNQFNLTTRRYTESEIKELAEAEDTEVRYLSLKDRFGDSGIVGVAILKYQGTEALIDTFLFSCRVIGRGVEDILLKDCINAAERRKCEKITGEYIPTNKNGQVEGFYESRGFSCLENDGEGARYSFSLNESFPDFPAYFQSIQINDEKIR